MDKDRPEPLIFKAFLDALHRIMIVEKTGVSDQRERPLRCDDADSLMKDHLGLVRRAGQARSRLPRDDGARARRGLALLVKRDGADMSQWRWGDEHVALLQHKVYSHMPLLDRLSDLSMPSSGGFYTLDRGGGFEAPTDQPFARTQAGGFRGLYDLADPDKSRFMITTGESGHIFSPHYRDSCRCGARASRSRSRGGGRIEARGA